MHELVQDGELVPFRASALLRVEPKGEHATLRPWAADFLDELTQRAGFALTVSSAVRTVREQKRLRRWNHNAAATTGPAASVHPTGIAFDIAKRKLSRAQQHWLDGEKAVGNLAAAEAFAAKAQELLTKHKLEMSDVEFAAEELNEPVLGEVIVGDDMLEKQYNYDRKRSDTWVCIVMNAVAKANFCKVLQHRSGKNTMSLVGRASDREVSKALFVYLSNACLEMAPREADMNQAYERIERRTFMSSFKLGFACAISARLTKKMAELKEGAQQQGLIRIDQMEKATAAKFKELFPDTCKTGGARASNSSGFSSGNRYGSSIGINSTKRLTGSTAVTKRSGINIFGN